MTGGINIPVALLYGWHSFTGGSVTLMAVLFQCQFYEKGIVIPVEVLYCWQCYDSGSLMTMAALYRLKFIFVAVL